MNMDEAIHAVRNKLCSKNGCKWNSFEKTWFDEYEQLHECYEYYDYYYAEDALYVIRNRLTHEFWFTTARSPYEAYIKHSSNCCEAHGHIYRGRDYSYEDFVRDMCSCCVGSDDCDKIPIMEDGSIMGDFRYKCRDFEEADLFY